MLIGKKTNELTKKMQMSSMATKCSWRNGDGFLRCTNCTWNGWYDQNRQTPCGYCNPNNRGVRPGFQKCWHCNGRGTS